MSDEYGPAEWQTDEAAATAEAVRRIEAAIASGATVLDFSDLIAMTRLPDELAKAQGVREIFAGATRATGLWPKRYAPRNLTYISALAGLTKLTLLDLTYAQVSDLSALSGLLGLTSLNLNSTQVSDLSALSGLSALTSLNLRRTQVSDLSPLSGLHGLTSLHLSDTLVSDLSPLSGLSALTALSLSRTQVSDLGLIMSLPLFASEQATALSYDGTPAANLRVDRHLDYLMRLPPDRCAIETVQYLKGTHPNFREPKTVNGLGNGAWLAALLAEASPVEVVLEGGLLQARNAGEPERLAPKELGLRLTALREQVAALLVECPGKQVSQDIVRRFERYAKALGHEEVTHLLLDGPMAALRGGLNDPFMTSGLDGGFLGLWAELVKMHDELRPLLLPREEDDIPDLRDDVTPEEVLEVARKVEDALVAAEADGVVGSSMVEAVQASADYVQVAKSSPEEKRNLLKRSVVALGGFVAKVVKASEAIGTLSRAAVQVQAFLATPWGQALVERLRPLLEVILQFI